MEVSLSQVCGPDDIITPISFEDELVELDMGGTLPQNTLVLESSDIAI